MFQDPRIQHYGIILITRHVDAQNATPRTKNETSSIPSVIIRVTVNKTSLNYSVPNPNDCSQMFSACFQSKHFVNLLAQHR